MQSNAILLVVLAVFLLAATRGGIFHLFIANTAFALLLPQQREIAGIALDSSDLMFFMIGVGCVLSPRFAAPIRGREVPYLRLWLLLGCILSISYISTRSSFLSDPLRAAYQLYRYCWKPILFYPLAAVLIQGNLRRSWLVAVTIFVLGGVASALHVGSFEIAEQLFKHKNRFGGALVAPAVLGLGLLLAQERFLSRKWIAPTLGAIWVALVLLGSRGAFVAAAFGSGLVVLALLRHTVGRARAAKLTAAGAFAVVVVVAVFPQLLSSQGAETLAEMRQGTEVHNLQWRIYERWPYFINIVAMHPWVGTGELGDEDTFAHAKGAHNGYLSLALQRGVPASLVFFMIPALAALRARSTFRNKALPGHSRVVILTLGTAVVAIMTHNIVETTVVSGFTSQIFWTMAGVAGAAGLSVPQKSAGRATQSARVRKERAIRISQRRGPLAPEGRPVV